MSSGLAHVAMAGADGPLPALAPGVSLRIGVQGRADPLAGRLVSSDADTIELLLSGEKAPRSIRQEAIDTVEVAHRRTILGFGSGVLAGAAGGLLISRVADESAFGDALAGALLAVPSAALGIALGGQQRPALRGALAGAAADGVALGIVLGGWCSAWSSSGSSGDCFIGAALLGAAFGAASGGVAAHVSRLHWMPVWARGGSIGLAPTKGRGAALVVRFAFRRKARLS
jgi:hypothetical protein